MNTEAEIISSQPFKDWLFYGRRNKTILFIASVAILAQFTIFKYLYPFAGFINADSYSYLHTAYWNLDVNTYMVGYSRFLRLFSVFTRSDTALVAFQYLMLQVSALYFLFTLFYFYNVRKTVQSILLCFMVFNPLFLYMANYVSSDAFFLALSFTWFTLLLWIMRKPGVKLILWHTAVVFIAFTVRYNALIYPFISILAFTLSSQPRKTKLAGISAGFIVVGLFVLYTGNKYKELTGTWQYSPFSGWQMSNNALYAYRYVDAVDRNPVPAQFRKLDQMVRNYFDSTRDLRKHPEEGIMASTIYMWDMDHSPLYKYRETVFKKDSTAPELKKWASMGPLYKDYGLYIIRTYPLHFARFFLWPNATKYYAPPVEFLESYNMGIDSVAPLAQSWFAYKTRKVTTRLKDFNISTLNFYPILTGLINVVMLFSLLSFIILKGWRNNRSFGKGILLGSTVWVLNAGFTIFASSAALRFQSFPILLTSVFTVLLVDWLWKMSSLKEERVTLSHRAIAG